MRCQDNASGLLTVRWVVAARERLGGHRRYRRPVARRCELHTQSDRRPDNHGVANPVNFSHLLSDPVALTMAMCRIRSVSGEEAALADAIEATVRQMPGITVYRDGNAVVARTERGFPRRYLFPAHIDTVEGDVTLLRETAYDIVGLGTTDMKSGCAAALDMLNEPTLQNDVTACFYDHEEDAEDNGLERVINNHPEWVLDADIAIVGEPTESRLEPGCLGNVGVHLDFRASESTDAITKLLPVLQAINGHETRAVLIDDCLFREGLNVVKLGNDWDSHHYPTGDATPDRCTVLVNYRSAPDIDSQAAAQRILNEVFGEIPYRLHSFEPPGNPRLDSPVMQEFIALARAVAPGTEQLTGFHGWTDVARLQAYMPAVNFGPGNGSMHTSDERVGKATILHYCRTLKTVLLTPQPQAPTRSAAAAIEPGPPRPPRTRRPRWLA